MSDVVIPVVFPEYLIAVPTPGISVDLPDFLPFDETVEGWVNREPSTAQLPDLGHAGVCFFNGRSGITKYYEYGRYDRRGLGIARRRPMPDLAMDESRPVHASLRALIRHISRVAGQGGPISGAYIEVEGKYDDMLSYTRARVRANVDPNRTSYDIFTNSCIHFVINTLDAAGVDSPWNPLDARPISYMAGIQLHHRDLEYAARTNTLEIDAA